MILLVHSCKGREWVLDHWRKFWDKLNVDVFDIHFVTDDNIFSDQLIEVLNTFTDDYIWYTLDDYFIQNAIHWEYWDLVARDWKVDALRLQPNVQHNSIPYRFERKGRLLKQLPSSAYTMSMQTSIWRRKYFLECLTPGLDPWELEHTKPRLGNVYFVPKLPFWYIDGVRRGMIRDKYKHLI